MKVDKRNTVEKAEKEKIIDAVKKWYGSDDIWGVKGRNYDKTPLYIAVEEGKSDLVEKRIYYGDNPNSCTLFGDSPLRHAIVCEDYGWTVKLKIVKALLEAGADTNYQSEYENGNTVAMMFFKTLKGSVAYVSI